MTRVLLIAATLLWASPAEADGSDLIQDLRESGEWTPGARLVLAQALWGEAGIRDEYARTRRGRVVSCGADEAATPCERNRDWELISWALVTRWGELRSRGRAVEFGALVEAYSSPVRDDLASRRLEALARTAGDQQTLRRIQRRRFLTSILWDGSNLQALRLRYHRGAPLHLYRSGWRSITDLVDAFGRGAVPKTCDATHWNRRGVAPSSERLRPVDCGRSLNAFYVARRGG